MFNDQSGSLNILSMGIDDTAHEAESRVLDDVEISKEMVRLGFPKDKAPLLHVVPLIKIAWADGEMAEVELKLIDQFVERQVAKANVDAGYKQLDILSAKQFIRRFLTHCPEGEWFSDAIELLRHLHSELPTDERKLRREQMIAACIDIAASSNRHRDAGPRELVDASEKRCLLEIIDAFYGT